MFASASSRPGLHNQDTILVLFLSCLYLTMSLSHDLHHQAPFCRNFLPPRLNLTQDLKTRLAQLFRADNTRE